MSAPPLQPKIEAMFSGAALHELEKHAAEQGLTTYEAASQILSHRVNEMCIRPRLTRSNNIVRFPK